MTPSISSHAGACATLALCAGVLLAGCAGNGEGLDPSGRPPGSPAPPAAGEFQQIQDTIFTPICTNCHAGASAPVGLRLDAANSYAMLVNVASVEVPAVLRVAPGDPQNSYLVQKIEGRAAVGARMPLGAPPLPQSSIDLVRSWIAGGAVAPTGTSMEGGSFTVRSTIPEAGETTDGPVKELLVVFNSEVDASLVSAARIRIEASGGDGRFDDGNERNVPIAESRVSANRPSVLTLVPATPLAGDDFRLVIGESAGISLADFAANPLDGDADGKAGGDFALSFHAAPEEAQ
jgi:hypothetical protein